MVSISSLLKSGFTPTLGDFNIFLLSLSHNRRFKTIIYLFSQLAANKIDVDDRTNTVFTKALMKEKKFEEAAEFLKNAAANFDGSKRNRLFDSLIQGFCASNHDPDKGISLLKDFLKINGSCPSSRTLYSLIFCSSRMGKMDRVFELLQLMSDEKFKYPFDNFVCSAVISGLVRVGEPALAARFYEAAVNSGSLGPDLVTCTTVVSAYCKLGKLDKVFDLVAWMENTHLGFDVVFHSNWAHGCFKEGYFHKACRIFTTMVNKRELDTISYTILIDGFSKDGNVEKAVGFLHTMRKNGLRPNLITHTAIILGFCKKRKLQEAFAVFRMLPRFGIRANEFTYAVLIDGVCRVGDFATVFELLDEMDTEGIDIGVVTYNTVINGLSKAGRMLEADDFSKCINGDALTYTTLLQGYVKEENYSAILETKRRLEESGVRMDVLLCNTLIKALLMVGLFEDAFGVYKRLPEMGFSADSLTYSTLIDGFCRARRFDEACEIFNELPNTLSSSSTACFSCIISGLCNNGMVNKAADLFTANVKKDWHVDRKTCTVLIKAVLKERGVEGAYALLLDTENELTVFHYTIVIDALCKAKRIDKALDLCARTKKKGIDLNIVTYNTIMNGLCIQGCLVEAFRLFDSLETIGLLPTQVTYGTLIDALVREGLLGDAKALFDGMLVKNLKPGPHIFNSLIRGYCRANRLEEAIELFHDLEAKDIEPDGFTISVMIDGHCRRGDMEGALEFFGEYRNRGKNPDFVGFLCLIRGLCAKGRMEESRGVLREMLGTESVVDLCNTVRSEDGMGRVGDVLGLLCDRGLMVEAVDVLNEVGSLMFGAGGGSNGEMVAQMCGSEDGGTKEVKDFDSFYAVARSLSMKGEVGQREANRLIKLLIQM